MDRVLRGRAATINMAFQVDGQLTDPAGQGVRIEVVRDDGTSLIPPNTPAVRTGVGKYAFTLTPTDTGQLDLLTARWTGTIDGFAQTIEKTVEICGGFFFTVAAARAMRPLNDTQRYPDEVILAARTLVEQALEDACGGVAFVPRYARDDLDGTRDKSLLLKTGRVRALRSIALEGVALTADELADVEWNSRGELVRAIGWPRKLSSVRVAFEHGHTEPPLRVTQAALKQCKRWLEDSFVDERATELRTQDGTIILAAAGGGLSFDIPEVNVVVERYGQLHAA